MSYTPIEGGLPENLLQEFRNIAAAFKKLRGEGEVVPNSPISLDSARLHTGGGRTAPFVVYEIAQGDEPVLGLFYSPSYGSGHYYKRLGFLNQDALFQITVRAAEAPVEAYLDYRINEGAWEEITSLGTVEEGVMSCVCRYTTPSEWNTLEFRVRNNGTASVSVFFNNANQAQAANAGTSGASSTTPLQPTAWTLPTRTNIF